MSLELALSEPHELDQWAVWFKETLAPADLEAAGVLAFMHHFADLGILEPLDENRWKLGGGEKNQARTEKEIRDRLEALSLTEQGFAVAYFLGRRPKPSSAKTEKPPVPQASAKKPEVASDLSNLQIVKKVGRQLKPFLDFEKETLTRLQGEYTQPKDARLIFNFILSQTQRKAEPKKWEQLSRKRHR
ncbi:MAG: hypothetical protein NPINA01_13360 [Nitrospinaceae bacterium]|nr:MAG: hypothetical protein NPINA01_13360 [Nitrospinaceae bacterium]